MRPSPLHARLSRLTGLSLQTRLLRRALPAVVLSLTSVTSFAQVAPPNVLARSWVIMDESDGQVLASANADARMEPASLTKLMTAYLTFRALQSKKIALNQTVLPSDAVRAVGSDQSRMFISPNKPVTVQDLLYGLIVQSGNDAAIALAELVGGSQAQFVEMMNAEAQWIGMPHTHYADVNGMPEPDHYSTANDLARLAARLISEFPEYYPIFSVKTFTYDNIRQPNRNRLLWLDPTVDGLKTGHTQAAGYCLIASANRTEPGAAGATRRVITVVMGDPSGADRVRDSMKLLDFAYHAFTQVRPWQPGQAVQTARVYEGTSLSVRVGVSGDLAATVPMGTGGKIVSRVTLSAPLIAPLAAGQRVGSVALLDDGKVLAQAPLVALEAVPQAGLASRLWDSVLLRVGSKT
ncbi:MAG: D-alanyl-D-alanine carboxypeptidase [Paraburkholderia sp.]|nr:D-alanyl-D-alanine carboxypeptidase [Paraburkholderia sp.]